MGLSPTPSLVTLLGESNLTELTVSHWIDSLTDPQLHTQAVQNHLLNLAARRKEISESNEEEKARMAERYNRGITHRELYSGDLVLLHQKESTKLGARWRGPFVVHKPGEHASFHIRQINGRRIKRTYHGDDLRVFQPQTGHLRDKEACLLRAWRSCSSSGRRLCVGRRCCSDLFGDSLRHCFSCHVIC